MLIIALGMMPVNDTYGAWPASGEIDISESRGNDIGYPAGGRNTISSSLHWGKPWSIQKLAWVTLLTIL